jgi:predicted dehydrogenase
MEKQYTHKTLGVIGCGHVASTNHIPVCRYMGFEISWLIDHDFTIASKYAQVFKSKAIHYQDFSSASNTDVVLITAPYGSRQHYYDVLKKQTAALFIEKPIARTVTEHQNICEMRQPYQIASGFQRRSTGNVKIIKNIIDTGLLGAIRKINCEFGQATSITTGAGFAKNLTLAGGGQLLESAIHNIDIICYLTQPDKIEIIKKKMIYEAGFDVHTQAKIGIKQQNNNEFEFDLLVTAFHFTKNNIEIIFDNAILAFSLFDTKPPILYDKNRKTSLTLADTFTERHPCKTFDVTYAFWSDFLIGLSTQTHNYTSLYDCIDATKIIEELYK